MSELFYKYINVEEDFIKALFLDGETRPYHQFRARRILLAAMEKGKLQNLIFDNQPF